MRKKQTVDEFIENESLWKEELMQLRGILRETQLKETVKWGIPVYMLNGKNIVGLGSFKGYFGLWFFQGVFLKDKAKKLVNAQQGKTKAMRQWRFNNADEIDKALILQYLTEAIENQKAGKEVKAEKKKAIAIPAELVQKLKESNGLKDAFEKFTPSKQREFAEYIMDAKREKTKQDRIQKIIPMILENVGLNDKYRR